MVHPIAKEIKVDQLRLADEAKRRLASLAMSVEIKERKRFPVSSTADLIVELINVSSGSTNPEVKHALSSLISSIDNQQEHLLIGFGASIATRATAAPEAGEKTSDPGERKYLYSARG